MWVNVELGMKIQKYIPLDKFQDMTCESQCLPPALLLSPQKDGVLLEEGSLGVHTPASCNSTNNVLSVTDCRIFRLVIMDQTTLNTVNSVGGCIVNL